MTRPVLRAARFALAHTPNLVLSGSKPRREILTQGTKIAEQLRAHRRTFGDAVAYAPHQVMIGAIAPEALREIPRPWHLASLPHASASGPAGMIIDEASFYTCLARADTARLLRLETGYAQRVTDGADTHGIGVGKIETADANTLQGAAFTGAELLMDENGAIAGAMLPGHEMDESLTGSVLLENLAAKVTGALALRRLLDDRGDGDPVDFLIGCGEEAVGDRYQRGGGNLAKAIGEAAGLRGAGAFDVKSFCAGPVHALILAGGLVASGMYRRVVVVAGGSLAKLGMKFQGHLKAGYPVLEDVLAGVAIEVIADDGRSPLLRLDAVATHRIGDGAAPHQMAAVLTAAPLRAQGLRFGDVDRYAVELHNPDITEPSGSGDVPHRNYQMIAALAAQAGEIGRADMNAFIEAHGMLGFAPTQGHIPSATPYVPHAIAGLTVGSMRRVQLIAKGSLFLGRMTEMADGASVLLERQS